MLGLAPARQGATVAAPDVYGAPLTGAVLASLGMLAFGMLALMPTTFGEASLFRTVIALSLAAGGVFGVAVGGLFAAESMFHRETDASKVALAHLVERLKRRGFELLDIQVLTPHTARLGAREIPRRQYLERLSAAIESRASF